MEIGDTARPLDGAAISAFLRSLPAMPQLLGLGEARHFVGELGELRNEIFRHLVEHEGFRSLAIESDCLRGTAVDDYIATGAGALDEVMEHGFSHRFGTSPANRELVRWMRAYNQQHAGREDGTRLRFFGFDGPLEYWADSPRRALTGLYDLLDGPLPCTRRTLHELLGPDERWSAKAAVTDPSQSIGQSADARRLRLLADDLIALYGTQVPRMNARDRERAALYGRTAVGLLRYHHWMADASPERLARLAATRDAMMAANLRAVAEHGPALVFSHNLHLQRDRSSMRLGDQPVQWWSAGAIAAAHLGDRYAVLISAFGTVGGDVPPPDTVEGALSALPWDRALVDARRLAEAATGTARRVSDDFAYFPLDPARLAAVDGVVFLADAVTLESPWPD